MCTVTRVLIKKNVSTNDDFSLSSSWESTAEIRVRYPKSILDLVYVVSRFKKQTRNWYITQASRVFHSLFISSRTITVAWPECSLMLCSDMYCIWTSRRVAFILTVHTVDLFRIDLIMANKENKRKIMIAMDGSEYSEGALKCKCYRFSPQYVFCFKTIVINLVRRNIRNIIQQ